MRNFLSFCICLSMILFISSCKDKTPPDPPSLLDACVDQSTAKDVIESNDLENNLIVLSISTNHEGITSILYDDESQIHICADQLTSTDFDNELWTAHFLWPDGSESTVVFQGEHLELNMLDAPFAPLSQKLLMIMPSAGSIRIQVTGLDGPESNVEKTFDFDSRDLQSVPVLGLYPNIENTITVTVLSQSGYSLYTEMFYIVTGPVPDTFPYLEVIEMNRAGMKPGFTLVSYRSSQSPNIPFIVDPWGKIRWYIDYSSHPDLNLLHYDVGVERLANGNYYFGNRNAAIVYEVDVLGEVINSWPLGAYNMHHHTLEKSDGNFLVTASDPTSLHENGFSAIDDHIVEVDRITGDILYAWDLKYILDENRTALVDATVSNPVDWAHINSVWHDESDNTIIVSVFKQGLVKFDYSGQVKWIFSNHTGWNQNRLGQNLNDYLLTAVDASGQAYGDSVQWGYTNDESFEWPWFQHAAKKTENGTLSLFDNGTTRNFDPDLSPYSRAVEYDINEENMTVSQVWTYGKGRGAQTFSKCCSDVDFLSAHNNVIFGPGDTKTPAGSDNKTARIVELDYSTKEVYWELYIDSPWIGFHRVERMTIYP